MSSTRTAKNNSTLHQERYASSPEFERGLMATRVAALCDTIESADDRELIWFIQYLSHQTGGLAAVAADLISRYRDRVGTRAMLTAGKEAGQSYTADEVRKIRMDMPASYREEFPLKGETPQDLRNLNRHSQANRFALYARRSAELERRRLAALADEACAGLDDSGCDHEHEREQERQRDEAQRHPDVYPVAVFRELCERAATKGIDDSGSFDPEETHNLERQLSEMCLNPEWDFAAGTWYFPQLVETLREYLAAYQQTNGAGVVVTALGREVYDALDYTFSERVLTLMHGEARTGKSFSARTWCELHPGCARFIEVPPFADDVGFFRAIARGLGLGNFLNYKANEIRDRVQSVLLAKHRDLILVLDEAQRLWPNQWRQKPDPKRIIWVMTMANAGVPIAMVATPQFIQTQKAIEKGGWNSAQLTGRIGHYVSLPVDLSADDLEAVAKSVLPVEDKKALRAVAVYARTSARYLAAIDSIAKRARYLSKKAGRETVTTDDVRRAMQESVIPSDTKLHQALGTAPAASAPAVAIPETPAPEETPPPRNRTVTPALASRRQGIAELAPG